MNTQFAKQLPWLLIALLLGLIIGGRSPIPDVMAQVQQPTKYGHYQVTPSGSGFLVFDSDNGALWMYAEPLRNDGGEVVRVGTLAQAGRPLIR